MNVMKIGDAFEKELKNFSEYILLASVGAKNYYKTNLGIIKHLVEEENTPGVYITLNKPFEIIKRDLQKEKVSTEMVIFIDGVTETEGKTKKTKECLFIGNPENLSDISIAMDQAVRALPGKQKFVFFDSLSTLLVYNNINTVIKFIHFLATKMREWKVKGIIITLQKESDKELIDQLTQICDLKIDL
ncbi:hypothetical protein HY643_04525 [Candidatus Woesearchaeota archaeon]|nr:hypothetical protein [Candidatus Woesearchaeota archaeon]